MYQEIIEIKVLLKDSIDFPVLRSDFENQYFAIVYFGKIYRVRPIITHGSYISKQGFEGQKHLFQEGYSRAGCDVAHRIYILVKYLGMQVKKS